VRGLRVLSSFDIANRELSLADIAQVAGVSRPSALRIAHTLREEGYLTKNAQTRSYKLGPKPIAIGLATFATLPLIEIAEPFMLDLRNRLDRTTKMAIRDDTDIIYVARMSSITYRPTLDYRVGTRMPALASSLGRVMVAPLSDDEIEDILSRTKLVRYTPKTLTDPADIWAEIKRVRECGYAVTDQGVTLERRAAAAAITNGAGEAIAAINVSVSVLDCTAEQLERDYVPWLLETAAAISRVIPYDMSALS
jgi:IclR family pca regulon transcriptional regulator